MRIMWYSNAPWCSSAYGRIMRELIFDHPEVFVNRFPSAMTANFGLNGGIVNMGNIPIYPGGTGFSEKEAIQHCKNFNADVLITIYDLWALNYLPKAAIENNLIFTPYVPFDWADIYPPLKEKLQYAVKIISMSKYGEKLCRKHGFTNVRHIPLGINTNIFKPFQGPKETYRKKLGFHNVDFVITLIQMNKGMRKGLPDQLEAIKLFHENNPDIKIGLYLHTNCAGIEGGFDLALLIKMFGLEKITRFPDQYKYMIGFSDVEMSYVYNGTDVLLEASWGEGFGYPIVEAMACGVPVIASNSTAMTELLEPIPQLLVRPHYQCWFPMPAKITIPDKYDIVDKLEKAVNMDIDKIKPKLINFAKKYDWNNIVKKWLNFLTELESDMDKFCFKIPEPSDEIKQKTAQVIKI